METPLSAYFAAIDPMALILSGRAYDIWNLIHNPHVPSVADVAKLMERVTPEEKTFMIARAKTLVAFGRAVEEAAAAKK